MKKMIPAADGVISNMQSYGNGATFKTLLYFIKCIITKTSQGKSLKVKKLYYQVVTSTCFSSSSS